MARSLSQIYNQAVAYRNQRLELKSLENSSKLSVLNALTWTTAACIWSFETLLDVFKVDLAVDLNNRINGTPAYYANALLKWQYGDTLTMNDTHTQFGYATTDESKQLISKVSYAEVADVFNLVGEDGVNYKYVDNKLMLKVAKSTTSNGETTYEPLSEAELVDARAYMDQIVFAGTHYQLVSRKGDEIVPKVTVYYDGTVTASTVKDAVKASLQSFAAGIDFDGLVYAQKVIDAIYHTDNVTDVVVKSSVTDNQGIYIAQYDDDGNKGKETLIERCVTPNSGYVTIGSLDSITFVVEEGK